MEAVDFLVFLQISTGQNKPVDICFNANKTLFLWKNLKRVFFYCPSGLDTFSISSYRKTNKMAKIQQKTGFSGQLVCIVSL